jgi:hypothetical protein
MPVERDAEDIFEKGLEEIKSSGEMLSPPGAAQDDN